MVYVALISPSSGGRFDDIVEKCFHLSVPKMASGPTQTFSAFLKEPADVI
jgi:hypothetical protein